MGRGGGLDALVWCLRGVAPLPSTTLLLNSWICLTGGLHLDGLADTSDFWGDRTRTLAVMQDPSSDPMAVTTPLLVLLKCAALAALAAMQPNASGLACLAQLLVRTALMVVFLITSVFVSTEWAAR
ncbi:hypothetical protein A7D35_12790 [Xanthomonas arboricola]|uniref:adenosylcobinamide-GDP ribazoletransferase n=1 Tax=Xanthomonas arboricola TaxID=56448 RepID=UPI0007ECAC03|nr:adenosylcobinamide-GDP ribazoletransferase [Xanthomonas arboricola]OBR73475.1 hypothetical protein A7D35_12790 [Xanthomonas arboricola]